jgi:hypothetical protein
VDEFGISPFLSGLENLTFFTVKISGFLETAF